MLKGHPPLGNLASALLRSASPDRGFSFPLLQSVKTARLERASERPTTSRGRPFRSSPLPQIHLQQRWARTSSRSTRASSSSPVSSSSPSRPPRRNPDLPLGHLPGCTSTGWRRFSAPDWMLALLLWPTVFSRGFGAAKVWSAFRLTVCWFVGFLWFGLVSDFRCVRWSDRQVKRFFFWVWIGGAGNLFIRIYALCFFPSSNGFEAARAFSPLFFVSNV
jgi:hypothetical protein